MALANTTCTTNSQTADKEMPAHLKPKTDERVWFTETRNCLNSDPDRALEEMWRTAEDQAYLKMQAGVKRGGRVCEDPSRRCASPGTRKTRQRRNT